MATDTTRRVYANNKWRQKIGSNLAVLLVSVTLMLPSGPVSASEVFSSGAARFRVETIAQNLDHPWGMAMMPDGRLLVTERRGRLLVVDPETGKRTGSVSGLPPINAKGQGGLLDIVCDPEFAVNRTIYFTFSEPGRDGSGTAVGTGQLSDHADPVLTNYRRLFTINHKTKSNRHFGSRIVISPDGTLLVTIGDRGERDRAQDPQDHAGSVIRIHKDGAIPADNPFSDGKTTLPEIWSTGHRNAQGATIHPETGELWTVEHGAAGGDEINRPLAGKNYGWPLISYGQHYSGDKIGTGTSAPGMEQPVHYWDPSIAPSGMAFYTGDLLSAWKGNLFVGALKDQMLVRLVLKGGAVVSEEHLLKKAYGRIRDVRSFPDGALWLLTDDDDGKLLRITATD